MPSPADPRHDPRSPPPTSLPVDRQIAMLLSGGHPTAADVEALVSAVLAGDVDLDTFGKWLVALAEAGETTAEIAGVVAALRARMVRVPHAHPILADTCGTGGDGSGSFNISTAAAIVVAGAGLPVAKHGNRAVSSRTGSADVLEHLGVHIDGSPSLAAACLADLGLAFCLAPTHHPAMARVGPLRRSLGRPTVFNLVGPLCNPAGATVQVIGVGRAAVRHAVAEAAVLGGARRVLVVSSPLAINGPGTPATGSATLDEVSLFGVTDVIDVGPDGTRHHTWTAEDFGLSTRPIAELGRLEVNGPEESAAAIRAVFAGESGPRRDVVVLNAAATLWAAGLAASLPAARALAERAIDDGSAAAKLAALVARSNAPVAPSVDA
jgi:anthranilate phosphoribosyltransferase